MIRLKTEVRRKWRGIVLFHGGSSSLFDLSSLRTGRLRKAMPSLRSVFVVKVKRWGENGSSMADSGDHFWL
jgi:hypothetical protein